MRYPLPAPHRKPAFMPSQQPPAEFGIEEARRVLREVFAPWVQDLKLSMEAFEYAPQADATPDWQPRAILRMPFSERCAGTAASSAARR
jgi:hypothetical protein